MLTYIPPRSARKPPVPDGQPYDGSEFHPDMSRGSVVLESNLKEGGSFGMAIDELNGQEARVYAIGIASQLGMADARLNGMSDGVYPVNKDGIPLDMVQDGDGKALPPNHPKMLVAAYRKRILVTKKLV